MLLIGEEYPCGDGPRSEIASFVHLAKTPPITLPYHSKPRERACHPLKLNDRPVSQSSTAITTLVL